MSCMPVSVLPSMERLSMVLLAFPQHAATTKIPQQPASPMVFERMAIFRAMLFSEYWIGRRDGSASSLAASPVTRSMPLANPPVTGLIWLPITRMPSIQLADAAPPPAAMRIPIVPPATEMILLAIKVSSAWLFIAPSPVPTLIAMPTVRAPGIGSTMLLLAMVVCCHMSPPAVLPSAKSIPSAGPAALPEMVLPVIRIWSQLLWQSALQGEGGLTPIPVNWMPRSNPVPTVVLEKVAPITGVAHPAGPAALPEMVLPVIRIWSQLLWQSALQGEGGLTPI